VPEVTEPCARWLAALQTNWPRTLCEWLERDRAPVVRAVIVQVRGSAPREPGACMLVSAAASQGTLGGGNLEWCALVAARKLISEGDSVSSVRLLSLVLGRELAQCCGGAVQVWLERFTPLDLPLLRDAARMIAKGLPVVMATALAGECVARRLALCGGEERVRFDCSGGTVELFERLEPDMASLWLYGAGHVGQALVRILMALPLEITWIDSRTELLPGGLPGQVRTICASDPVETVRMASSAARFLVMTHDHSLDYTLCRAILERGSFTWLGLIGSKSKAARFRARLAREGIAPGAIARLNCPIGMRTIASKLPAAIAVGVAAQLLEGMEQATDRAAGMLGSCAADCASCAAGLPT
jgi:xanthine dehydrogenase accessory factor